MRKEPFTVDNYVHVYNRGNRKQLIVQDEKDRWRFLQMLYYFNSEVAVANPFQVLSKKLKSDFNQQLVWPNQWISQKPIVKILAFCLMENHFHLLLKEIREGGITMFMRKLGTGMTNYFNAKYQESGRLFQGAYKAKVVDKDVYLQYLSVYIQVKNPFELYPGGLQVAMQEFDKAFNWVVQYSYCSLGAYAGDTNSPIIEKDILGELFPTQEKYRDFVRQCMLSMNLSEKLGPLTFDLA